MWKTLLAVVAMLLVQVFFAASQIMTKASINEGASVLSLLTYRHIVATLCIAPLLFFIDRGSVKKLTDWRVWIWAFLAALAGITMGMGLFYYGLRDTTATYATNFSNLIPIVTFFLSVLCGMEKVKLGERWGQLKVIGALLCVGGALVISLYAGPRILGPPHHHETKLAMVKPTNTNTQRGTILIVASCVGYAFWFIVQAKLLQVLPSKHWGTLLTCLLSAIQTMVLGLCLDHRSSSWKLGWDIELATILSSGVLASAASFFMILWAIDKKGPAYPSLFDPLSVVFVALVEALFFGEVLTVGMSEASLNSIVIFLWIYSYLTSTSFYRLIGMVIMIMGLYCYLWGQRGELLSKSSVPTLVANEPTEEQNGKVKQSLQTHSDLP